MAFKLSKCLGLLNSPTQVRKSKLPHIFQLFNFTRGWVVETSGDKKSRRAIGLGGRNHPPVVGHKCAHEIRKPQKVLKFCNTNILEGKRCRFSSISTPLWWDKNSMTFFTNSMKGRNVTRQFVQKICSYALVTPVAYYAQLGRKRSMHQVQKRLKMYTLQLPAS